MLRTGVTPGAVPLAAVPALTVKRAGALAQKFP